MVGVCEARPRFLEGRRDEGFDDVLIALLTTIARDGPGGRNAAFARFAGAALIERQLDLAARIGAGKIFCLTDEADAALAGLRARARRASIAFHTIPSTRRLSREFAASDELLIMNHGVLADDDAALATLQERGVLAFPVEGASTEFERIDAGHRWAGILRVDGAIIEQLLQLGPDVDPIPTMLRLALQSGAPIVRLDPVLLEREAWHIAPSDAVLRSRATRLVAERDRLSARGAPGTAMAERIGIRLVRNAKSLNWDYAMRVAAPLFLAAAVAAMVVGYPPAAFLCVTAAIFWHIAAAAGRNISSATSKSATGSALAWRLTWDGAFFVTLILAAKAEPVWLRAFIPAMLFLLLNFAERRGSGRITAAAGDRVTLGFALTAASFAGVSFEVAAVVSIGIAVLLLLRSRG